MPTAESVARYFLHLAAMTEEPSPVTQMQLHKLLYYAQGWALAQRGEPLFSARFQAWAHGPVAVDVYPKFADYDGHPISKHDAAVDGSLTKRDRSMLESIWTGYGRYSAWQLREMTHNESPWQDARRGTRDGARSEASITEESMLAHFRPLHERACKRLGMTPEQFATPICEKDAVPWEVFREELLADSPTREAFERITEIAGKRGSRGDRCPG